MLKSDTVYTYIKPLWIGGQILGLSNRNLLFKEYSNKHKRCRFVIIYKWSYNFLFACILGKIVHTTFTIDFNDKYNATLEFAEFILAGTNTLCGVVSVTFNLANLNKLLLMIKKMHKIDTELKKYCKCKWISYKAISVFVAIEVSTMLSTWVVFLIYYLFVLDCPKYDNFTRLTIWFFRYVPTLMAYIYVMQFISLVLVLKRQSEMINNHLSCIKWEFDCETHLLHAMHLFFSVGRSCKKLNRLYSLPLLAKFANQITYMFTFCFFCIFGYTFCGEYVIPKSANDYLLPVWGSIPIFVEFMTVVIICELLSAERKKTGKLIHEISNITLNLQLQNLVSVKFSSVENLYLPK